MGLLIYGYKERKEQEKQSSQGKKTCQVDPTAPRRSAIRRPPSIPPHSSNTTSERRNGRASPRSVRLSLQNYEVAERGGEVVFSRRPPASRFASGVTNSPPPPPPPDQPSRRTHRAEIEDRQWQSIGGQAGSAQTMAEMAEMAALDPLRQQLRRHRAADDETDLRRLNRLHEVTVQAALRRVQEATRTNRGNEGFSVPSGGSSGVSSGLDSYPPRDDPTLMSEVEEMRRSGLGSVNNPRIPPYFREMHRQIPAYDDLTIDARRELDSIMGTHLPPPPPRMDGLGDRVRSPSTNSSSDGGEDAWETLLTTMTPDARLPSLQSSFNTAAAENVAASMSGGSNDSQRSNSSSRTRAETTATSPSLIDGPVDSVTDNRRGVRLQSPGCEEEGNGIATPDSLPELVRVERVRSPAVSVRPDHVQGGDNDEDGGGDEDDSDMERYNSDRMQYAWWQRQRQRRLNSTWSDSAPAATSTGSDRLARSQGNRSFDEARRDLEREIEEFSRSRMQRLLADFMARGDSDGVPEELWQAFVPRNVLAGAASEDNNDQA